MTVLITGAGGMLAQALALELTAQSVEFVALDRNDLDVTRATRVDAVIDDIRPRAVLHCAAYTRVDDAEANEAAALAVNGTGAENVARACARQDAQFIYPSTDYVFDGSATVPYAVDAPTHPINAYGRSKLAGEVAARNAPHHLVVRTSWLYGAGGPNFVRTIRQRLQEGAPLRVVNDQRGAPSWTGDVARTLIQLIRENAPAGVYHATNSGQTTWHGFAVEIARLIGIDGSIEECPSSDFPRPAARPHYSVLDCSHTEAIIGPSRDWRLALADALDRGAY